MEVQISCAACGRPASFLMKKEEYPLFRCSACGLVFMHPQPAPSFLKEEVYSAKSGYQGNKPRDLSSLWPTKKQAKTLSYLARRIARGGGARLLDVGCSNGDMMHFAERLGYEAKGVELNQKTASIAQANGLDVFIGFLEDTDYAAQSFDVIHLGDLIEHVNDPAELLDRCRSLLAPGGEIIIVTPNLDCFWSKSTYALYAVFGTPWSSCTPPHHLFQFSYGNMKLLLEKKGFAIARAWYDPVRSLAYELGSLHMLKRWKRERSARAYVAMCFGYALYMVMFGINRVIELLPLKRVSMTIVAAPRA